MKQVFVPVLQSYRLAQLLQRPGRTGMCRDVAMDQAPAAVLNHHENVQQAKRRGDGDEKIARDDPLGMQAQEGRPAQVTSRSAPRTPRQILPHGSWRNSNSQFQEELIGNAFLTPRDILVRHPADQRLKLRRNRRSAGSRLEPPE
jgi:hypothetical protein